MPLKDRWRNRKEKEENKFLSDSGNKDKILKAKEEDEDRKMWKRQFITRTLGRNTSFQQTL